ncbi:MAG: OsmC family peroxiredoxin [Chitinophagia bacterium]|nr:OsmC family peroxiredoxin [Chitinophagia bacterium]
MTSKVTYTGDLRTIATHLQSGTTIETDAPVDNHGKGERFSPTDLVATALASCMLTTIGINAAAHDLNIDGATCEVEKIMTSNPRKIGEIKIWMTFPQGQIYTDKQKQIIQRIADTCPVMESLHPDCIKTLEINWQG